MNVRCATGLLVLAIVSGLVGCGGGGGSNGVAGPMVTVEGAATYDAVPNINGGLSYNATASKPIRGAGVDVVDAQSGTVLASTATDDNGKYSVGVQSRTQMTVRVRAQVARSGPGPNWDVSVRDNTQSDALYSMESPVFSPTGSATVRDLHAPSGWGGSGYTGERVAGPFAILDTVYTAMNKVLSVAPSTTFPPLRVFWSTRNAPSSGLISQGQIGTTSFVAGASGLAIYVVGLENVDTDEYDESVIAHEWGHYYQNAFSRDDSPGGQHGFNALVDQRLAFSEGWGNAWSGIALERRNYTDSMQAGQGPSVNVDLAATPSGPLGWYREDSVQTILWRLNSRFGLAGIHQAMTGGLRTTAAVTSIHSFAAAFGASSTPAAQSELSALLAGQSISGALNDPWATLETNDAGIASVLPIYRPTSVGVPVGACVTNRFGDDNRVGSFAYLRVAVPSPRNYRITVSGPANADPDIYVYAGRRLAASEGLGASESVTVALPAGDVVVAVNDANNSSSNTCYTIQIN
jgi:hypothetical protein